VPAADPLELADIAERFARQAAAVVDAASREKRSDVSTKTTRTDMVTATDRASERLIVEALHELRPGDGILGEEGSAAPSSTGVRWLIDPIDGTTNFLYGLPGFSVSIAAEVDGEVVAGVVAAPRHDEVFRAAKGHGATCNGTPIHCNDATDLPTSLVATGFGYDAAMRVRQATVLAGVIGKVRDIRRYGSAAIDLCWVACGRVDAYYERGLNPWDLAAGEVIAREAGARTASIEGGPARPGSAVAAAPGIFDALLALLAEAGA
jgi:myo-inositol-1(or 4)-monophosphatase